MQSKWIIVTLMVAAFSWFAAGVAFAAPIAPTNVEIAPPAVGIQPPSGSGVVIAPQVTNTITSTVTPTATLSPGNQKIADAIAKYFDVDEGAVEDIHDQAHGWGQVFLVFMLADKTGMDAQDIWDLREEGQGWGAIFSDLGVKHGLKGNNLGSAITGKPKPSDTPAASSNKSKESDDDKNCKPNVSSNGKGNACVQPGATPPASNSNRNNNNNGNGNSGNNNGNGKGKSGK